MKRKSLKYILSILLLLITISINAQHKLIEKADAYFYDFNYLKALILYQQIEQDGYDLFYVCYRIGDCYRHLNESHNAIVWYEKATQFPEVKTDTYLLLYNELRKVNRYDEADKYLNIYNKLTGGTKQNITGSFVKSIQDLKKDSLNYLIYHLPINSVNSDIGPVIYNDYLVFTSNRKNLTPVKRTDVRNGNNFYKLYVSKRNDLTTFTTPKFFDRSLNSKYNDGPVAFNKDQSIAYVTRNVDYDEKKKTYLNIFVNYKKESRWQKETSAIPLHQVNCSFMHACIAKNDELMYFVSDMAGGFGGLDIYVCKIKYGFLSKPVNLGSAVNSPGNEVFPFVGKDGRLYYSSDKQGGFGGLDIYMALLSNTGFAVSFNLGYPLNTSSDDFGLVMLEDEISGYFVSNRPGGVGKDDIYAFRQRKNIDYIQVAGIVLSKETNLPVKGATVKVFDGSRLEASVKTNVNGEFILFARESNEFILEVKDSLYNTFINKLSHFEQSKEDLIKIFLDEL
jgi:tetratricopeptide (TPR) repeat protein